MHTRHPTHGSARTARHAGMVAGFAWLALLCAQAQAQSVQKCRIDGRIVYQSSACPTEPRALAAAPQAAATDTASAPKKKTLAELLRERQSDERVRAASPGAQSDGANVLRARMGAL